MSILINRNELNSNLTIASKAINNLFDETQKAITFSVGEDSVTISAYGDEIDVEAKMTANVERNETNEFTLSAKTLTKFVGKCVSDEVEIVTRKNTVIVKDGEVGSITLPIIEQMAKSNNTEVSTDGGTVRASDLAKAAKKVLPFVAKVSPSPVLKGVKMLGHNSRLILVACDGYAMAKTSIGATNKKKIECDAILPAASLDAIASIAEGDVQILNAKKGVAFIAGNVKVTARAYAGDYIDYDNLLVKANNGLGVEAQNSDIISALNRLDIYDDKKIPIKLSFLPTQIIIERKLEAGESKEIIPCRSANDTVAEKYLRIEYAKAAIKGLCAEENRLTVGENTILLTDGESQYMLLIMRQA